MIKQNIWFAGMALTLTAVFSYSCKKFSQADKNYDRLEYAKAIPMYKKGLKNDTGNSEYWAKLGDCYRKNNQVKEAESCYEKAVSGANSKSIYKFDYAQTLMSNEKYADALVWMEKYLKEVPDDSRAANLATGLNRINDFFVNKDKFKVENLTINSSESDYGPSFYKEGIIFTSSRETKPEDFEEPEKDGWTGKSYYALYYSKGSDDKFEAPVTFLKGIQTKYHNTSACFSLDGNTMFLTRNNVKPRGKNQFMKLQIFVSTLHDGQWTSVVPFPYNSDNYSCAHPALSADGKKLFFTSDMPGTKGSMDLWYSVRTENGWDVPVNCGPAINTKGNEVFPSVDANGNIYFSSNGHEGIGGLDLYCTRDTLNTFSKPINLGAPFNSSDDDFCLILDPKKDQGYLSSNRNKQGTNDNIYFIQKISDLINNSIAESTGSKPGASEATASLNEQSGTDLNSSSDDLKIGVATENASSLPNNTDQPFADQNNIDRTNTASTENKYVESSTNSPTSQEQEYNSANAPPTSNNPSANTNNDIDLQSGNVTGNDNANPNTAENTEMKIGIEGKLINNVTGQPLENVPVKIVNLSNLDTVSSLSGKNGLFKYYGLSLNTSYRVIAGIEYCDVKTVDVSLTESKRIAQTNINLFCNEPNASVNNIYYDFDKYAIRPDAAKELDKLVSIMKQRSDLSVEVNAYADCRGSKSYNMVLSQKRAAAAVAYLESKGIERRRLLAIGYGENKPVNECFCASHSKAVCTEEDYQRNRRTEFRLRKADLPA